MIIVISFNSFYFYIANIKYFNKIPIYDWFRIFYLD